MPERDEDQELAAIQQVIGALTPLDAEARTRVIHYVFERLGITGSPGSSRQFSVGPARSESPPATTAPSSIVPRQVDIRTFREEKNPRSANEMAAVVAYYLAELAPPGDRRPDVLSADIERYFKQANFRLPAARALHVDEREECGLL